MGLTKGKIEKNLQIVRENIAAACFRVRRPAQDVSIIAVTKSVDMDAIKLLIELGVTDLGENRVGQLVERCAETQAHLQRKRKESPPVRWHLIGHLQRNKAKAILGSADVIHSVDSLRLAEELNERAGRMDRNVEVLLQVNCSQESQKSGCAVGATIHLAELISTLDHLTLTGLMTMAEFASDPEKSRPTFALLGELFDDIRSEKIGGEVFRHLSMGMSQDYGVAVEEGATLVRIGAALFS